MNNAALEDYTDDRLLNGRVVVRQPTEGYRVAIDPVLLAAAVQAPQGGRVMDAGCGSGAAMFCLAARRPDLSVTGLDKSASIVALAGAGIALNKFTDRMSVVESDLSRPPSKMGAVFDVVMTNPPFAADGTVSPQAGRAVAHHESNLNLVLWVQGCLACLKAKGRLVMIHRADRLSDIMAALRARDAGDVRILPIHPKAGEPARRIIIDAGKGRRSPDTILPGFVLHEANGDFTPAADAVLRDGGALPV